MLSRACVLLMIAIVACGAPAAEAPRPADRTRLAKLEASLDTAGRPVGTGGSATLVIVFASWCEHCHKELDVLAKLRPSHPGLRVIGVNYKGHEEYEERGSAEAVQRYVARHAPWLRVVPADEGLFDTLGRPPKIPTLYVFDRTGVLVQVYSRVERGMPDREELATLLRRIGV